MHRRSFVKKTALASLTLGMSSWSCNISQSADADVLILGAGLAGLHAAALLEKQGYSCLILEAQNRIGGRLYTRYDLPNQPDFGGRAIGDQYQRVMAEIQRFDLPLTDVSHAFRQKSILYLNGQLIPTDQWAQSRLNALPEGEKSILPGLLESTALRNKMPYKGLEDWFSKDFHDYDQPLSHFLSRQNRSEEALKLINLNANYNDIHQTSAVNALHSAAFRFFNGSKKVFNLTEGSSRLPEMMAASLEAEVRLNKKVSAIEDNGKRIKVQCEDGSVYQSLYAISTIPFPVFRNLDLALPISAKQQVAIEKLNYTHITQIHIIPRETFWEEDQLAINMWTDSPLERIMNFTKEEGEAKHLVAWINGDGAKKIDQLAEKEIRALTLKTMAEMRPASAGKIEVVGIHSWGRFPYAKGAYAEFEAGQVKDFFPEMIQPAGRLHFAGEHTAKANRGMEGAMESGERAASEISQLLSA